MPGWLRPERVDDLDVVGRSQPAIHGFRQPDRSTPTRYLQDLEDFTRHIIPLLGAKLISFCS